MHLSPPPVAWAAVRSKVVALLLLFGVPPIGCAVLCSHLFCCALCCVLSSFAISLVGWPAVCDCGFS